LEVKGPDGSAAVAKRQACYDGALGTQAMYTLQILSPRLSSWVGLDDTLFIVHPRKRMGCKHATTIVLGFSLQFASSNYMKSGWRSCFHKVVFGLSDAESTMVGLFVFLSAAAPSAAQSEPHVLIPLSSRCFPVMDNFVTATGGCKM